jgi:putative transposase
LVTTSVEGAVSVPKSYPEEFRRKVLDLVAAGRPVAQIAADLGISDLTIYGWRKQELIDTGQLPGLNRAEQAELSAANKRIRELENEVAILKRARELLREPDDQKAVCGHRHDGRRRTARAAGLPTAVGGRIGLLRVALTHAVSAGRRHAWLTEQIRAVHSASRGIYGARRIHAELTLGLGLQVGHNQVELLMARAAIKGLPGNRRPRPRHETPTAADLVERMFTREAPNRLWVTDITEHRTYEGKVYCAVVLDTFSRRVVGWSIDSSQTAALVTNALSMAIANRDPQGGGIIHSDHGVQGGFNPSSQHGVVNSSVVGRQALPPVFSTRVSCGAGR